jgi:hypothetical protein
MYRRSSASEQAVELGEIRQLAQPLAVDCFCEMMLIMGRGKEMHQLSL